MPTYEVHLSGRLLDVWTIEADTPGEAAEQVRRGKGEWQTQEWLDRPDVTVEPLQRQ